jgi:phenylacetate-CoA ligase
VYSYILTNIILPAGDFVFGSRYISNLKRLRKLVYSDEEYLKQHQSVLLKKVLEQATVRAPYYSNLKIERAHNPVDWLKKFPILTKDTIRTQGQALWTLPLTEHIIKNQTSGSTGLQTTVFVTKKEQSYYRAAQTLWWEWAGYRIGTPILQTGQATSRTFEKRIKDLFFKTYYLFAFGIDAGQAKKAFLWSNNKNAFLGGYASSLYVLSEIAEKEAVKITFKSAVSWGDKLFDHYRKNVERVFNCKIYETYGAGEGLMIAAQKDLQWMYIMSPCVYLEIVDDLGNEVPDGEMGHVVVTSLTAFAMPLIRYKLGDLAIKLPRELYPQNRSLQLPLLQKVIGRDTDLVVTPRGKKLIVHSFTGIFEYFPQIKQFCVIQEYVEGVLIQYIPGDQFDLSILLEIQNRILSLLNEPFDLKFEQVSYIPVTKSGKPQLIISKLQKK